LETNPDTGGNLNTYTTSSNTNSYSYYRLIIQSVFSSASNAGIVHLSQFNLLST
jgi:serine/threonine-protein kinase RIO1